MEGIIGSLEVGKWADIIVLDRKFFEIKPEEIHNTNVLLTMLNGNVVFEEVVSWELPPERQYDMLGDQDTTK